MKALPSSSFRSTFSHPNLLVSSYSTKIQSKLQLTLSSSSFLHRLPHISSSVRFEEKPQASTATTTPTSQRSTKTIAKPTKEHNLSSSPSHATTKKRSAVPARSKRQIEVSLPAAIFNALDGIINNFIDPPLRPSVDPRYVLSHNFAPVDELPPTECHVIEGSLPSCLEGAYIRNGPNPQFLPRGPYHLFDGDGMLHSIKISKGKATLCSRYVKTYKYTVERDAGSAVLPNVFSSFNGPTASAARGALTAARVLTGQINLVNGTGLANTSLAFFGNTLYALG